MKTTASPARDTVPTRWAWHQRALLQQRRALIRERDEREHALREARTEPGGDVAEAGSAAEQRYELLAELRAQENELAEIDAALARLHDGTYGICARTGKPIAPARLRAVPWARYAEPISPRGGGGGSKAARRRPRKGR